MTHRQYLTLVLALALFFAPSASAGITKFWGDQAGWNAAAGDFKTVDFIGLAPNTFVTDQFSDLGVTFTPGINPYVVQFVSFDLFPSDGYGIDGNGVVEVVFSTPQHAIAAQALSVWRYDLFEGDVFVGSSGYWPGQPGDFFGITTTFTFDRVILHIPGDLTLDNLYFSTVPSPGAAALLAVAAFRRDRRRR